MCEQFCACGQECVESSRALCIEGGKEQQERAETAGCADTFDAYLTCLDENFECTGGGPQLPPECESLADEISTCTAEQS
ncbi:MAG: hypothetical protein R3B70_37105 [Polyangiaceae bacterium]